jgi:hypothetical protein
MSSVQEVVERGEEGIDAVEEGREVLRRDGDPWVVTVSARVGDLHSGRP